MLDNLLKTDSDFDAFCLDYFPQVKNRLTNGMDRVAKMNLLIETSEYDDIPKALLNARYAPYINIKNPDKDLAWIMEKMLEVKLPQNDEYIPSLTRILGNPRILKGFSLDKYIIGDYLGHGGSGIVAGTLLFDRDCG